MRFLNTFMFAAVVLACHAAVLPAAEPSASGWLERMGELVGPIEYPGMRPQVDAEGVQAVG